jgi:hypothetical protein
MEASFEEMQTVGQVMSYGVPICSFHDADGRGTDINGRTWRWEFSRQFGPLFVNPQGKPLKAQPAENSPAWGAFNKWYANWQQVQHTGVGA